MQYLTGAQTQETLQLVLIIVKGVIINRMNYMSKDIKELREEWKKESWDLKLSFNGTDFYDGHDTDKIADWFISKLEPLLREAEKRGEQSVITTGMLSINDDSVRASLKKELCEEIEKIDVSGGGNGRRLKSQIINLINSQIEKE